MAPAADLGYTRPQTVEAAVAAVAGSRAGRYLAGGMTLVPQLTRGEADVSDLVDIARIPALHGIETIDRQRLRLGALATHDAVARSTVVAMALPGLAHLAAHIGDAQVRNRGTLGGAVAVNDPCGDYPAALIALAAEIVTDRRRLAADGFFVGPGATALDAGELITAVEIGLGQTCAYEKIEQPASGYALVGVMVARRDGQVRVAVTGAASTAFRVPAIEAALAARFAADAVPDGAVDDAGLVDTIHASRAYRAHLVSVLARRAVARLGAR